LQPPCCGIFLRLATKLPRGKIGFGEIIPSTIQFSQYLSSLLTPSHFLTYYSSFKIVRVVHKLQEEE